MSYVNCPRCGLAILLPGARPLIDGCPGCQCRSSSASGPPADPGRAAGNGSAATTNIFARRGVWEPGIDRLLTVLDGVPRRRGDRVAGPQPSVSPPPPRGAA